MKALAWAHNEKRNLKTVLKVLTDWSNGEPRAYDGKLIKGLSVFLSHYPQVDAAKLASRLAGRSPGTVLNSIKQMADNKVPPLTAGVIAFRDIYNTRNRNPLPVSDAVAA